MMATRFAGPMVDVGRAYTIDKATQFATGHPTQHDCDECNKRRGQALAGTEPWVVRFFKMSLEATIIDFKPQGAALLRDQALFAFRVGCSCLLAVFWPNEKLWADDPTTNLDGIEGWLAVMEANHTQPGCKRA